MVGSGSTVFLGRTIMVCRFLNRAPSSRSASSVKTMGRNVGDAVVSLRNAFGEEKTRMRSLRFLNAGSSSSKRQQRNAIASSFESPQTMSEEGAWFSIQFLTVSLKCSTEGANSSFGNSGSVTDAHTRHCSSSECTPGEGEPMISDNQP